MVLVNNLGTWTGQLFNSESTNTGAYSPFFTFTLNPDGTLSAENQNTGSDSTNNATSEVNNDTDISLNNNGNITNNVLIDANTGNNSASRNTGNASIQTGDVNVAANILNILNNNFMGSRFAITIVNVFGGFFGNIRQGDSIGVANVQPQESIAITPTATTKSFGSGTGSLGSGSSSSGTAEQNSDSNQNALVLSSNSGSDSDLAVARFAAKPGLFDDLKLQYLLLPVIFGVLFTLSRRVLARR
jgi:hypothetical protein